MFTVPKCLVIFMALMRFFVTCVAAVSVSSIGNYCNVGSSPLSQQVMLHNKQYLLSVPVYRPKSRETQYPKHFQRIESYKNVYVILKERDLYSKSKPSTIILSKELKLSVHNNEKKNLKKN